MTKRYRILMGQSIMDISKTRASLETRHIYTIWKPSKQTNMQHRLSTTINGPNSLLRGIDLSEDNITISTRRLTRDLPSEPKSGLVSSDNIDHHITS